MLQVLIVHVDPETSNETLLYKKFGFDINGYDMTIDELKSWAIYIINAEFISTDNDYTLPNCYVTVINFDSLEIIKFEIIKFEILIP